jgi:hypothetical protein
LRLLVLAGLLVASVATADERVHASIAGGGLVEVTEPQLGAWGAIDLWPRGSRWGARADGVWLRTQESLLVVGSVARQLGATRPRLAVSLVAGAGVDVLRPALVLGGGLWTQFGVRLGPLALFGGLTGHLIVGDERFELRLVGALGLGIGR